MFVFRSFSGMIDDGTRSQLQELYTSLYVFRDLDPDDVASDDTLQTFNAEICVLQDKYNESRTAKVFLNIPPMLVIGRNSGEHCLDITRLILFYSECKNEATRISSQKHMIFINMHRERSLARLVA